MPSSYCCGRRDVFVRGDRKRILRTNRVLSNFQDFFDTYSIRPGDGMYVAPEDRVRIW